ncbi:F0F1 ATP synthase subunit B [Lentibacter sp. XHP0401]|jgi:F-type H+-transporting ATPase subunit b|uniref:F0F1 ATP synthase subunit B n=1 Tax=Lentibacter sp. XHP0401 TaxID=2984334 RepID=UPI0021E7E849|nr:F0F1 ATP synthase subunit B [Lentibacter sp. XHP0401]MCV2893472.1 F0F1 ATP synthase subunit B [Lentibacter sp. XHP0401]
MRKVSILLALTAASPAMAASKNPFSGDFWAFGNTDLIVTIAFFVFIGVLFYFNVPAMIGGMLDKRAEGIKSELGEARALREEAQKVLADYERKQKEVQQQANRIVETAKEEAAAAAEQAKADIKTSIARRLAAAEDRLASAEASAVKEVRDSAIVVAVAAARDVVAKQMTAATGNQLIDDAISQVEAKLH